MNRRKAIRDYFKEKLTNDVSEYDQEVYTNRFRSVKKGISTFAVIYTDSENVEVQNDSSRIYKRTLNLTVHSEKLGLDHLDDHLDAIAIKVEKTMLENQFVDEIYDDIFLRGTSIHIDNSDSDKIVGVLRIDFDVIYYTKDIQLVTNDFGKLNANYEFDNVGAAETPSDDVNIPTT